MLLVFSLALTISMVLIFLNSSIAKKSLLDREKISAFECGFDPKSAARCPFSLRFYLIAVIFLIFDVEITLILPIPMLIKCMSVTYMIMVALFFITILLVGLFHEWTQGALEWN